MRAKVLVMAPALGFALLLSLVGDWARARFVFLCAFVFDEEMRRAFTRRAFAPRACCDLLAI
jgi:hypothetical protein